MSAVLIVTKDRKQLAKVPVAGNSFMIGRAPDCSLPLDESLASRHHVEILFERGSYWVRDGGSRNGTSLNGEKIPANTNRELKDGDEIAIGTTQLKFAWDKAADDDDDADKTRVAASVDSGKKLPGQEVVHKRNVDSIQVKLRVVDGPLAGGIFRDWESPLTIGRSLENNVVLVDDAISTRHAQIVQEGESYYIVDLKSSNGTFLDGIKVQKTKLVNGSKIKIGISTLVFEMVDLRQKRKNLKIALISLISIALVVALVKFLQPPDIAGQHIAAAQSLASSGELARALEEYEAALKVDPERVEAKRGAAEVREAIDARDVLTMAENEAAAENYDKAEELCYRVLRDYPKNSRALELEAVIKSVQNAKIAFASRNWLDAKRLLEKAQETYPKSQLIGNRLTQAKNELTAQQNLAKAGDAIKHEQFDMAQPMLQSIPNNSVYFTEARQALDQIAKNRRVSEFLSKSQTLYRDGNIAQALQEIDAGLQQSADNTLLLGLQQRVRQMESLVKKLAAAEAMSRPEDVEALLLDHKACSDVVALESDPLNSFRKRAQDTDARISEKLHAASQVAAAQAAAAMQSGNRKEAFRLFELAVRANPADKSVADQRDQLRKKIVADCRAAYQEGVVHDDLGQSALAKQAYQKVLDMGIPGEDYYERANRKLRGVQ